jgi:hypothetical protein
MERGNTYLKRSTNGLTATMNPISFGFPAAPELESLRSRQVWYPDWLSAAVSDQAFSLNGETIHWEILLLYGAQ